MRKFLFAVDQEAESFWEEVAEKMVILFNISKDEAIGRINEQWKNTIIGGSDHITYHENTEYWAQFIYYENGTYWWLDDWMKANTPKPGRYPKR